MSQGAKSFFILGREDGLCGPLKKSWGEQKKVCVCIYWQAVRQIGEFLPCIWAILPAGPFLSHSKHEEILYASPTSWCHRR